MNGASGESALKLMKNFLMDCYLRAPFSRKGRLRLFAEGFDAYGLTLTGLGAFTSPLIFEDDELYGIAGSYFTARYRGRVFAIAAQHCLTPESGKSVRIGFNPKSSSFLPLKNLHLPISVPPNQDFADIAILEVDLEKLTESELKTLPALDLDQLRNVPLDFNYGAKLAIPGYPKFLNSVDYDNLKILTQCYFPSGNYAGGTNRLGIHQLTFDELEQIDWADGMSGSPVYFVEEHLEAHYFGLAGILIKAQEVGMKAEFIGADVLFQMLDKLAASQEQADTDKPK